MTARETLSEWVAANVDEAKRGELSRLTAAFVADAVRADRAKREAKAAKDKAVMASVRAAIASVEALGDPSGMKRTMTDILNPRWR